MVYKNFRNILVLVLITVWLAVFNIDNDLHIIACDVGQGDAILIQKNTTQILIDGGPDKSVLDCLGKYMPFWDKQIELVILTHPQEDHYGGLIDVFKNYEILLFGEYDRQSGNLSYQVLGNIPTNPITLTKGTKLRLGMIYLDILHPSGNNQITNSKLQMTNTNDTGIVILMKYARFKALFTADVENEVSDELSELPEIQNLNYIKVNHHGSKNGLSQKLLDAVDPDVAVISVGKKNSYGHPNEGIIKMLNAKNINIKRTDQEGDINIKTDGIKFWYNE
jgi:competence protein ComEC